MGKTPRRFSRRVNRERVRFSTVDADLRIGESSVRVLDDGRYAVHAQLEEDGRGTPLRLDLVLTPAPRVDFPGATIASGDFASGYAVPGLRATASGSLCVRDTCDGYDNAQAYHDHNWGGWKGVTWEWGATRAGAYTVLYGRVSPEDSTAGNAPLFVYITDSLGFLGLFRPSQMHYEDTRTVQTAAGAVRVPARAELFDTRNGDTLRLTLTIDDAVVTDTRIAYAERGETAGQVRALSRPWFVQMAGESQLQGRVRGVPLSGRGRGFFETYR